MHAFRALLADKGWLENVKIVTVKEDIENGFKHHTHLVEGMHGHTRQETSDCLVIDFEDAKGLEEVEAIHWESLEIQESGVPKPGWKKKLAVILVLLAIVVCYFKWPEIQAAFLGVKKCVAL